MTFRCIGIRLQDAPHRLACSTANSRNLSCGLIADSLRCSAAFSSSNDEKTRTSSSRGAGFIARLADRGDRSSAMTPFYRWSPEPDRETRTGLLKTW